MSFGAPATESGLLPPFVDNSPTVLDGGAFSARDVSATATPASEPSSVTGDSDRIHIEASDIEDVQEVAEGVAVSAEASADCEASPLPASWLSTQKSKREVPQAVKTAGIGIAMLLLLVFVAPSACGSDQKSTHSSMIVDGDVEDAEFLKKRRHLTDEDFRPRGSGPVVVAPSPPASTASPVIENALSIEERQRLREANPEDIRSAQTAKGTSRRNRRSPHSFQEDAEDSPFIFFNKKPSPDEEVASSPRGESKEVLIPAASIVRISLSSDVVIRSGRTTVLATVPKGQRLPAGTKLLGQASAGYDGAVSIRFDSVVLPSGVSVQVRAEAMDVDTGSSNLVGSVAGGPARREDPSVARSVGTSTAGRMATGFLGGGIAGGAAQQTLAESSRSRGGSRGSATVVSLAGDTKLQVLFLREVLTP